MKYKMDLHPYECEKRIQEIKPIYKCFYVGLDPHCDCGTSLGIAYYDEYKELSQKDELEKRFSELKEIGANIDDSYNYEKELWGDLPLWIGFLKESLDSGLTSSIGLIKHWEGGKIPIYQDPKPTDSIWIRMKHKLNKPTYYQKPLIAKDVCKITLNELSEVMLVHIKDEVLYEFVKD